MKREPITDVPHKTSESLPNTESKDSFQKKIVGNLGRIQKVGDFPTGVKLNLPDSANKETGYWLS